MKILFLIRRLDAGGAQRQTVELALGFSRKGYEVVVFTFYSEGLYTDAFEGSEVKVECLNKAGRWELWRFFWRLKCRVADESPDFLYSLLGISNILSVCLKPFVRTIRVVWGIRASNMDLNRYGWIDRVNYQVECWLSRFADKIIANSHAGLEYAVQHGFPKEKMVVIPNGIDTDKFSFDTEARRKVRNAWGIVDDQILIGLVARFDPMKDHPTFFRAAAMLAEQRKDVRFVCVGDGMVSYKSELKRMATDLGIDAVLIWAGERSDMPAVYNALDILASSSSFGEGFPNVIGEAMACGVPCVVTDVGDCVLIVGVTGVVVAANDPGALADGLRLKLNSLGRSPENRQKPRERIVGFFSVNTLIENTKAALW